MMSPAMDVVSSNWKRWLARPDVFVSSRSNDTPRASYIKAVQVSKKALLLFKETW